MISEIKGKISSSGSNLTDRLEDKLTGDFFGALRYLPFEEGLKIILGKVEFTQPSEQASWKDLLNNHTGTESIEDIRELSWYGVMVDLTDEDEEGIPVVSIINYQFDLSYWNRLPAVSDHWTFFTPFFEEEFTIIRKDNKWDIQSNGKAKKKYSGFEKLLAKDIPLFDLKNPEDISSKIFGEFEKLNFQTI